MTQWLIATLTRLLRWLDPPADPPFDPVAEDAAVLILEADGFAPGTSGEYKRHYVYARLQKTYPDVSKRRIALTIEQVLGGLL